MSTHSHQVDDGTIEPCRHGSEAPEPALRSLPRFQGGTGRHRCTTCAYELGREQGRKEVLQAMLGILPPVVVDTLRRILTSS